MYLIFYLFDLLKVRAKAIIINGSGDYSHILRKDKVPHILKWRRKEENVWTKKREASNTC